MFNNKKRTAVVVVIILIIIGIVLLFFVNKNSVKSPAPGSLFDLSTFDKKVLDKYVGQSQLEEQTSVEIKGVKAFATSSLKRRGEDLIYGSRVIANCEGYCQILPFNVNDKLLYMIAVLNKPITVYSENEIVIGEDAGYYSMGDLIGINNQLVFYASKKQPSSLKPEDVFVVYDSQKIRIPNFYDMYYKDGVLTILTIDLNDENSDVVSYTKKI